MLGSVLASKGGGGLFNWEWRFLVKSTPPPNAARLSLFPAESLAPLSHKAALLPVQDC